MSARRILVVTERPHDLVLAALRTQFPEAVVEAVDPTDAAGARKLLTGAPLDPLRLAPGPPFADVLVVPDIFVLDGDRLSLPPRPPRPAGTDPLLPDFGPLKALLPPALPAPGSRNRAERRAGAKGYRAKPARRPR